MIVPRLRLLSKMRNYFFQRRNNLQNVLVTAVIQHRRNEAKFANIHSLHIIMSEFLSGNSHKKVNHICLVRSDYVKWSPLI